MIATDILISFWKRKNVIALFVAVSLLACHVGLFLGQNYTATVYVKYLEEKAVDGVATNGTKLNPYEITDSYIISKTLKQLGMENVNVNEIAQRITVTPVSSAAELEKYASWLDQFSDYDDTEEKKSTPVYYRIDFNAKEGVQFARIFLSSLIEQYRSYYTERYAGFSEVALVSEAVVMNLDYFHSVQLLKTHVEDVQLYLSNIVAVDTDYRSPETGYSLQDLIDAYDMLIEIKIAPVMQYILDHGVSKDISTLKAELQQSIDTAQRESDENAEKADTQKQMMMLYAEKNQEYVSDVITPEDYDDQIYGDVERDRAYVRDMTTYDQMMLDYVEYEVKSGDLLIDKAYTNENLSKFDNTTLTSSVPTEEIAEIYGQYVELMDVTEQTLEDYNTRKSGSVMLQVSGTQITETMPELLFYSVSGILSVCLGCGFIVICEIRKTRVNNETK